MDRKYFYGQNVVLRGRYSYCKNLGLWGCFFFIWAKLIVLGIGPDRGPRWATDQSNPVYLKWLYLFKGNHP